MNAEAASREAGTPRGGPARFRYDIEADWYLLDTCNYRCSYCFFSEATLGSKLRVAASNDAWRDAFQATGLTWLIHLTGGEPTIYPDFPGLCAELTKRNVISFNSNLSQASVRKFAEAVDPRRVSFINAGFHAAEREARQGAELFLKNLDVLKASGFPVFVSVVATPEVLADMERITAVLKPAGFVPIPKMLRGKFAGRRFPDAYSFTDRRRFRRATRRARAHYAAFRSGTWENPSIDPFVDDDFLSGQPSFRGRSCQAGARFVSIGADGSVARCNRTKPMGNLLEGTFRPNAGPAVCDTSYCFYFCLKYASPVSSGLQAVPLVRRLAGALGTRAARETEHVLNAPP